MEIWSFKTYSEHAPYDYGSVSIESHHHMVNVVVKCLQGNSIQSNYAHSFRYVTHVYHQIVSSLKTRFKRNKRKSLVNMMSLRQASPRTKAGAKWLSKVKKGHMSKGTISNSAIIPALTLSDKSRDDTIKLIFLEC